MDGIGTQAGMISSGAAFDPLIFSPLLWLKDTGSDVSTWEDQSGFGRDAIQNTVSLQPSIVTTNGMQVRRFASDYMVTSAYGGSESFDLFLVAQNIPTSGTHIFTGWGNNFNSPNPGGQYIASASGKGQSISNGGSFIDELNEYTTDSAIVKTANTPTLLNQLARPTSATSDLIVDGGIISSSATKNNDTGSFTKSSTTMGIGSYNNGNFILQSGDICEIIHYPALLESERLQVEAYLIEKWGI